jgi:hypothetical protein
LANAADREFSVGQVWRYNTRQGEERSTLTIVEIDQSPELGMIVHVSVKGVRLHNCHGNNEPDNVEHMPFARKLLEASVTELVVSNQPLPDF